MTKLSNFISAAILPFAVVFLASCDTDCISGSGPIVTQELDLAEIESITSSGSYEVRIEQATDQRVVAIGHQNIIDDLRRDVVNGTWPIELRDNQCYNNYELSIELYLPEIREISSSGSADIVMNTFDSLSSFTMSFDGSGRVFQSGILDIENSYQINSRGSTDIFSTFNASDFGIFISGSGNAKLAGTTGYEQIGISGSGDINAFDLDADTCVIGISGSGDIEVHVNSYLDVEITGSGDVRYTGQPQINSRITGSGRLIDAN